MADLTDLIARLEAATEGNRELSDAVLLACGWTQGAPDEPGDTGWRLPGGQKLFTTHTHLFGAPSPTTSIDAALTLVEEGYWWSAGVEKQPGAYVWHPRRREEEVISVKAATPALALTIAALRARQANE